MGYFYAVMWLLIGLLLIFRMTKENKIFYLAGGFFIVLGIWWFLDMLLTVNMFEGIYGIAFKVFTGIILVILVIFAVRHYMANEKAAKESRAEKGDSSGSEDRSEENKDW